MNIIITGIQAILIILVAMVVPGGMALLGAFLFKKFRATPTEVAYLNEAAEVDAFIHGLQRDSNLKKKLFWVLMPVSVIGFLVGLLIGLAMLSKSLLTLVQF